MGGGWEDSLVPKDEVCGHCEEVRGAGFEEKETGSHGERTGGWVVLVPVFEKVGG